MARKHCYEHPDRTLMAYCDMCGRPCCHDCTLEISGDYYCEGCRDRMSNDLYNARVYPGAMRTMLIGCIAVILGVGLVSIVLGPYVLWRAKQASDDLERVHWMRGHWHVRASYILGGLATCIGVITLSERFFA